MAGEAIFIGWGQVVRGREQKAFEVFGDSVAYWGSLQQDGRIDSFDVTILTPHGGDLAGFALLRGDAAKLAELRRDDEFVRTTARANQVIDSLGVVDAATGDRLGQLMGIFQEVSGEFG